MFLLLFTYVFHFFLPIFISKFSLIFIAVANASDSVLELFVEPKIVSVGDNVLLRCEVTNLVMGQFIRWSKVVEEDGLPITYNVATNGLMEIGFKSPTSRYSANYDLLGPDKVEFRLSINST